MKVVISGAAFAIEHIESLYHSGRLEEVLGLSVSVLDDTPAFAKGTVAVRSRPDIARVGSTGLDKSGLVRLIATEADLSKAAAGRALDAVIGAVESTLKKSGNVSIVGFGTFAVSKSAARSGRNPRTGAAIKIKAAKVPKFTPGKKLKDAVN